MEQTEQKQEYYICQHITAGGNGIPCGASGTFYCQHCQRRICVEHTRARTVPFSLHKVGYCEDCNAAIEAGEIRG